LVIIRLRPLKDTDHVASRNKMSQPQFVHKFRLYFALALLLTYAALLYGPRFL